MESIININEQSQLSCRSVPTLYTKVHLSVVLCFTCACIAISIGLPQSPYVHSSIVESGFEINCADVSKARK